MQSKEKNEVFSDYAAFLNALLPHAVGFMFHDRHARLFWHDNSPDTSQLNDDYHKVLRRLLFAKNASEQEDDARVELREGIAFLLPLTTDNGKPLGVLTALCNAEVAGMPYKHCLELLQPALRSLSRELNLRMHLLETTTRLTVEDGEQDFMRMLGDKARSRNSCEQSLRDILELTINHLGQDGAVLVDPQHELSISVGSNPVGLLEAEMILESMQELAAENPGQISDALAMRPKPGPHDRSRSWPILKDDKEVVGVLILSRPANMFNLSDRSNSLMNFVVSTIEHVIERGFDPLTGLINWPGFETALEAACSGGRPDDFSLMFLDLDQLHVINDNFGRATGDEVLRGFADIIRNVLNGHQVTRVSSDSFAVLIDGLSLDDAQKMGQKICDELRDFHYAADQSSYKPSACAGVAPLIPNEDSIRSVLVPAQVACQAAKGRGRSRCEKYVSSDDSIIQRMDDLQLIGSIQKAIESGLLVLYAQPIVRADGDRSVSHHEVLVRMQDTSGETIQPDDFLGAAERYQLMQELDRWVVSRAFDILRDNKTDSEGKPLYFHVNLSGQSLGNDQFLDFVRSELSRTAISPDRIGFEITETVAVKNMHKAKLFMQEFKQMGCKFSLDDFGTGLSSFAYLKLFPIDRLKVDGSFIKDLSTNQVSRSMVSAIVEIARVMDIETVAEYVESETTLEAIREIGIDWAQGYHIGKPQRLRDVLGEDVVSDETQILDLESSVITGLYKTL